MPTPTPTTILPTIKFSIDSVKYITRAPNTKKKSDIKIVALRPYLSERVPADRAPNRAPSYASATMSSIFTTVILGHVSIK
jgi:hypothetical protein